MSPASPRRRFLAVLACSLAAVAGASQALTIQPGGYSERPTSHFFPNSDSEPCFGDVRIGREPPLPPWECDPRRGRQERGLTRPGGRHVHDDCKHVLPRICMYERPRIEEFRAACCVQP